MADIYGANLYNRKLKEDREIKKVNLVLPVKFFVFSVVLQQSRLQHRRCADKVYNDVMNMA